jgi:hypothetical protein
MITVLLPKTWGVHLFFPIRNTCSAHFILLMIILIIFGDGIQQTCPNEAPCITCSKSQSLCSNTCTPAQYTTHTMQRLL